MYVFIFRMHVGWYFHEFNIVSYTLLCKFEDTCKMNLNQLVLRTIQCVYSGEKFTLLKRSNLHFISIYFFCLLFVSHFIFFQFLSWYVIPSQRLAMYSFVFFFSLCAFWKWIMKWSFSNQNVFEKKLIYVTCILCVCMCVFVI